jgi:hypothetical protein
MKMNIKNSTIIFVIIFIVALVAFKKLRTRHLQPAQTVAEAIPASAPLASASPTNKNPEAIASSPVLQVAPILPAPTQLSSELANPFCSKKDFVIIPSLYLRGFYHVDQSKIALPQSLASCFQKNKKLNFVFFDYQHEHQIPWLQLVTMRGRITDIKSFDNFNELKTKSDFHQSILDKNFAPMVFQNISSQFQRNLNEKWAVISIWRDSIDEQPLYWPNAPFLHPVAEFISVPQLNDLKSRGEENLIFLDARSMQAKAEFKLPYPTAKVQHFKKNFGAFIWEPSQLSPLRLSAPEKILPQSRFVIIAANAYDLGAVNAANYLTIKGYRSIYILKDGAVALGGPPHRPINSSLQSINAEGLKRLLEEASQSTVIIDCRTGGPKHFLLPNSITLPKLDDEAQKQKIDVASISAQIAQRAPQSLVFVGYSDTDPMPEHVASMLSENRLNLYKLRDGFKAWRFYSTFKWDATVKKVFHRTTTRAHARPPQIRINNNLKTLIKIAPERANSPRSVKPSMVKPGELDQIKKNNYAPPSQH